MDPERALQPSWISIFVSQIFSLKSMNWIAVNLTQHWLYTVETHFNVLKFSPIVHMLKTMQLFVQPKKNAFIMFSKTKSNKIKQRDLFNKQENICTMKWKQYHTSEVSKYCSIKYQTWDEVSKRRNWKPAGVITGKVAPSGLKQKGCGYVSVKKSKNLIFFRRWNLPMYVLIT